MSNFTFNASALGVGGIIDHADGTRTVIPSLASVSLAPTGGEGSSIVENYSCKGVSFTRAESRVAGYETSCNKFTSYSDVFVTGLTVFDRFKVALMQVTMTSTSYVPPGNDPADTDSTFDLRAIYRGVQWDGEEIIPSIDLDLCGAANYNDFAHTMGQNRAHYAKKLEVNENVLANALKVRNPIVGSIVSELRNRKGVLEANRGHGDIKAYGNKLIVPEFGTVRFGEFLVKPGRRRINLLRFTFGEERNCDQSLSAPKTLAAAAAKVVHALEEFAADAAPLSIHGSLTVGSGDGNGVPIWPRN